MADILFENNAYAQLLSGINDSQTTITVKAGQGSVFPAPSGGDYFYATLEDAAGNIEIVRCTQRSGDTLTVVRGQDGTSATTWNADDVIGMRVTQAILEEFVQRTATETLTNKTLTSPTILGGTASPATLNLPSGAIDSSDEFAAGVVDNAAIGNNAIGTDEIADSAVATEKIANDAVTNEKLDEANLALGEVAVTDAGGSPVVSTTELDLIGDGVISGVPEDTWESVGPNGSGADNIWPALTSVPVGVDWIRVRVRMELRSTSSGQDADPSLLRVYARKGGSSATIDDGTLIAQSSYWVAFLASDHQCVEATIPVDGNIIFDIRWGMSTVRTPEACAISLVSWGWNHRTS